ncbi:MAG: hypothetical protein AB1724_08090 [Thermodesulfobacteriota bacterium]
MTYPDPKDMTWIVAGTSMSPFLKAGDFIRVRPAPFESLGIGDVVLLESDNPPCTVVHRLIGWRYQGGVCYGLLKGDNAVRPDAFYLTPANYRGRVCASQRAGRKEEMRIVGRSGLQAVLSRLNLNIMDLRRFIKAVLMALTRAVFPVDRIGRLLLARSRCYVFNAKPDSRKAWLVLSEKPIAEIRLVNGKIVHAGGISVFSLILSPEILIDHFRRRYPGLTAGANREDESTACPIDSRLCRIHAA